MKLFGIATLASGALANLYSEYQALNSQWSGFNFNGKNAMTETRKAQLALSEDEQCMWDELQYMKDVYYAPLFCTPWGWNNGASWQNLWRGYMEHWKHFEASYYRNGSLMTCQTPKEKKARDDATSSAEASWWAGKLDSLIKQNQKVMELFPSDARSDLESRNLLNNYTPFTETPHPCGWEGYYVRPTLSGTCYVTKN